MRVLLASSASYDPPRGGSTRGNLAWLEHLAESGHECRVVSGLPVETPVETMVAEYVPAPRPHLTIRPVESAGQRAALREEIARFGPDWVLVSSEDLSHVLLDEAQRAAPGRVVYLAHTPQFYPFGPAAWNPSERSRQAVIACAGIVAIARFTAAYVYENTGRRAAVIHPPIYGAPPFRRLGRWAAGAVAMINPCEVKGVAIFRELARGNPGLAFAALPGWGTTPEVKASLGALGNFRWIEPCRDIEQMLERTRILLVPSLWMEGFGLIVVEAMLRGIPVLAADAGGLRESALGAARLIPVKPIERFQAKFDAQHLPVAEVPEQEIGPWQEALDELIRDEAAYERVSRASYEAANEFVRRLDAAEMERYLAGLQPAEAERPAPALSALSAEKRALLERRLRQGR
jgi:glycosyltransferase involved in cell wall biosynthesis